MVTSPVISPTSWNSSYISLYFWLERALMGLVKITLCFSLRASAMAYLQGGYKRKPGEITPTYSQQSAAELTVKLQMSTQCTAMPHLLGILTQHRRSCQPRCGQKRARTRCCQYTRWPHAEMGPEQTGTPARQERQVKTKEKQLIIRSDHRH